MTSKPQFFQERETSTLRAERESAALYVADLAGELAQIARRHGLPVLAHILDMANHEAASMRDPEGTEHKSSKPQC